MHVFESVAQVFDKSITIYFLTTQKLKWVSNI